MRFSRACPCCGNTTTAYTVHLNSKLVLAFLVFADCRIRTGGPVRKGDLELDNSQYGNFQKLRHFGLIAKAGGDLWEMTPLGWDFVRGRVSLLNPAGQFGNATLEANHPAWATHAEGRKEVRITDVLPAEWRERASYVAEKAGAA